MVRRYPGLRKKSKYIVLASGLNFTSLASTSGIEDGVYGLRNPTLAKVPANDEKSSSRSKRISFVF
ncbi:hypothetical protein N7451_012625 [Penicillium sp. IBT 35674x]|nr:hypothetical protein N7451_012625 [Penicillium sp. IBT 35674x]